MTITTTLNHSSPSNFELCFPKLPSETTLDAGDEFTLSIFSTIVPSLNLDLIEHRWMGSATQRASGNVVFEPWNINFIVDVNFTNWQLLYNWVTYINNAKDDYIKEHSNYAVDATLRVTDNFQAEIFKLFFVGVWITNLGEVTLSYREGDQVLECSASFAYDYFESRST